MSAAKTKRAKHDAYLTPDRLAQALVTKTAHIIRDDGNLLDSALEPSAGEGAFVRGLYKHFNGYPRPRICAVEPRAAAVAKLQKLPMPAGVALYCMTFEQWAAQRAAEPEVLDLIIGNPPFSHAEQHIALARKHARYVAFLLRLSMLGSQRRAQTLWNTPGLLAVVPLAQRPAFIWPRKKKKGTDNSEYGLFVWRHGYSGDAVLHRPLVLDNPKKHD